MMDTTTLILLVAAFVPAAFYMLYIIAFDDDKPEPPLALLMGALVGIGAAFAVKYVWPSAGTQVGTTPSWQEGITTGFLGLAVPAEIVKWIALFIFLSLNRFYDEYIDGIVYSVCLAMGFAGLWSVWFLTDVMGTNALTLLEMILFLIFILVPIQLAAGTMMGYFFALARETHRLRNFLLSLLLPILIEGVLCSMVLIIGNHWEYYFIAGILFSILAMIFYTQAFRLLEMDSNANS